MWTSLLTKTFAIAGIALCAAAPAQTAPDKVLFIGNSLTYSRGGVDTMLNNLCLSAGRPMDATRETVGGMRLSQHAVRPETLARIRQGGWDVVVLQGHSNDATQEYASFNAAAHTLDAEIKNVGARTMLYMTWAYQDSIDTDMNDRIQAAYYQVGSESGAEVVPCGIAWKWMCDSTGLRMYDDYIHPNTYGVYMVGCMFYAALFDSTPVGISYSTEYGIGATIARNIQTLVWRCVDGDMSPVSVQSAHPVTPVRPVSLVAIDERAFSLDGRMLRTAADLGSAAAGRAWQVTVGRGWPVVDALKRQHGTTEQ